ncbi:MAG TPA: hypothetical protein VG942_12215, partial [Hyphomonadaceae bacterium]|nr:hypothetical protein [Hyphomonadaceae bacterium]
SEEVLKRMLKQLADRADEVVTEHRDSEVTHSVAKIATRIGQLARRAAAVEGRAPTLEITLLGQLADAAVGAFATATGASEITSEIAQVVDRYLSRG